MAQTPQETVFGFGRSNWVRMRTHVVLRWFAILGQIIAVGVATYVFGLRLEFGWISVFIGASILLNICLTILFPENRRLSEGEAILMICFDLVQLSCLLFVTGGLDNPFALLILAPVTIGASMLPARSGLIVAALAIVLISLLAIDNIQLMTGSGFPLVLPQLFIFGFWVALVIGVLFIGLYARQVTQEMIAMGDALSATQMALAREQKLTDLGGVVAAAAHELGTPLATIKLVSSEMLDDLDQNPDLKEDALLIRDQADRCRDILRSMGRAGKDDKHLRQAPFEAVIRDAAEPHLERGISVGFSTEITDLSTKHPVIERRPEIIHGIRNLIQNAVDFAQTQVGIEINWTHTTLSVRIIDDGEGFPPSIIGRIGDPFVRRRRWQLLEEQRPNYDGMGLGLFIAKTLLERTGAVLKFANGGAATLSSRREGRGAIVEVIWPRASIEIPSHERNASLGKNEHIA